MSFKKHLVKKMKISLLFIVAILFFGCGEEKKEVEEILAAENMFFPPGHELFAWNPIVYETVALYSNATNIYNVFAELARRTALYQSYGDGKAPVTKKPVLSDKVPDL